MWCDGVRYRGCGVMVKGIGVCGCVGCGIRYRGVWYDGVGYGGGGGGVVDYNSLLCRYFGPQTSIEE